MEKQCFTLAGKLRLYKEAEVEGPPCGIEEQIQSSGRCSTGFKSHVIKIKKGSNIVQGLATFAANNPDEKVDDLEPKALAYNQGPDINANISNSENPNTDHPPEDEQKVGGGKSSVSV